MTCTEMMRTQAWLDGELEGADAAAAERHAESCLECQAQGAEAAELSDLMRKGATRHSAPGLLRARVRAGLAAETRPRARPGFWAGAASGIGACALAAGLALLALLPPSAATLAQSAVDAHTDAMIGNRAIMVASSSHHTVKPWFAGKVALSPPVADFAAEGFVLAGGRLDQVGGTRTAVVVYRHGAHQIDLFVWPDHGAHLGGESLVHGYRAVLWKKGDLDFAAVSDMDAAEMAKFVALVKKE